MKLPTQQVGVAVEFDLLHIEEGKATYVQRL